MPDQSRGHAWLLGLSLVWFGLDQAVKGWIQTQLTPGQSIAVWPDVFHVTLVYNTGAAFSLFQQHPQWLLGIGLTLLAGLLAYGLTRPLAGWQRLSLSLMIGGAMGNVTDRLLLGQVVDYLDVTVIRYPIFNLADVFIFTGAVLLMIRQFQPGPAPGGPR